MSKRMTVKQIKRHFQKYSSGLSKKNTRKYYNQRLKPKPYIQIKKCIICGDLSPFYKDEIELICHNCSDFYSVLKDINYVPKIPENL